MALTDVEHVEAVTIVRALLEQATSGVDVELRAGAEDWLERNHPSASAYAASARSLSAEAELDREAGQNGGQG